MPDEGTTAAQTTPATPQNRAATASPSAPSSKSADRKQLVKSLIREHGSAGSALYKLATENKNLRHKNAALQGEDVDGLVILRGDDAKKYRDFVALNLEPAAISAALTEREQMKAENGKLQAKVTKAEREERIARAAKAAEKDTPWKANVLADLAEKNGFDVEEREVKDGGETQKVWFAVKGDEAAPLAEFAPLALYHAALRETPAPAAGATGAGGRDHPGTPTRATGSGKTDVAARHIAQVYVTPSQRARQQSGTAGAASPHGA